MKFKTDLEKEQTKITRAALIASAAEIIYLDLMGRRLDEKKIRRRHKEFSRFVYQLAMRKLRKENRIMTVQAGYSKIWYEVMPI